MAGRFVSDGYHRIMEKVGQGPLKGVLLVDQLYAQDQHEDFTHKHPQGGMPKYLSVPLAVRGPRYWQGIADALLTTGPVRGMIRAVEGLSDAMGEFAPVEHGYLKDSGHPMVFDNGSKVYDRAPKARRLSEAELNARIRAGG